jgi:ABC-2 type transport system ATP-binding protein
VASLGLHDISFRYSPRSWALSGLEAELDGRVLAVLGPNGAGKSTLLGILSLQLDPTAGTFTVGGRAVSRRDLADDYRRRLGFLPQHLDLFSGYTCREFLRYVSWMREVPARAIESAVSRSLALVELEHAADLRITTLSGGMRQRLGLAQALVNTPGLLILDEPTVGLDPRQRAEFRDLLRNLDCQIIIATHLVDDVAALAESVLLIDEGRTRFAGPLAEFCGVATPTAEDVERSYLSRVPASVRGP